MCAVRRRPSLPAQTSLPHASARRLPPRFPIGEYTGVHSVPTFSRRPFPAPFHFCASRAALSPRFTLPQLVPPPFAFPSFPQFRASARHFPALRPGAPRSSPRRSTRFAPLCFALLQQPQISAPATRSLSSLPASRFSFFFSLLPSRARQSRPHHVSQTPRPGFQPPAGRRLPASPPDLSLQKSLLFHASPPLFEHN